MARRPAATLKREKQATIDAYEAFLRGECIPDAPIELFVEASNVCDLKCAMCPTFSAISPDRLQNIRNQDRGFFDLDRSWRSLQRVLPHVLYVHAFGYGEPTIHPKFLPLLEDLARFEVMSDFITNGMHLEQTLCDFMVDTHVSRVTVSLSGATKSDYESVYLGGDFDRVLSGLKRLSDTRAKAGSRYPRIVINSIGFQHHIERLPEFMDLMAEHGVDNVEVKKLVEGVKELKGHAAAYRPEVEQVMVARAKERALALAVGLDCDQFEKESPTQAHPDPATPIEAFKRVAKGVTTVPPSPRSEARVDIDLLELPSRMLDFSLDPQPLASEVFGTDEVFHCLEPFKTLYVRKNGLSKPCCFAPDSAPSPGNVSTRPSDEVWHGAAFKSIRESIAVGEYPTSICAACVREGTTPKNNTIRNQLGSFTEWYYTRFGKRLSISSEEPVTGTQVMERLLQNDPGIRQRRETKAHSVEELAEAIAYRQAEGLGTDDLVRGYIDVLTRTLVSGWVYSPHRPGERWEIHLEHATTGELITSHVADDGRLDLRAAGMGDGMNGFQIQLPDDWHDGGRLDIEGLRVRIPALSLELSSGEDGQIESDAAVTTLDELAQRVQLRRRFGAPTLDLLAGFIDVLGERQVVGWAFSPCFPTHHFEIEVWAPGHDRPIARTTANAGRNDISAAGYGDGTHGFEIELPTSWGSPGRHTTADLRVVVPELGVELPLGL